MGVMDAPGLTARLARLVAEEDCPMSDAWRDLGERAFVDTVGVLLAGHATAPVVALTEAVVADGVDAPSRCLAAGRPTSVRSAALHAGLAAERGVLAAQLAGRGFTADPDQLEGPMGFLALYGGGSTVGPVAALTEEEGEPAGLNVKLHPCCYATHAAIDAALELAATLPGGARIAAIQVVVPPGGLAPVIHHRPVDGLQAKFSLEYAVAAALLDREVTLASFDDNRARRADVQQLLRTVEVATAETPPAGPPAWDDAFAAVVTVHLTGHATA